MTQFPSPRRVQPLLLRTLNLTSYLNCIMKSVKLGILRCLIIYSPLSYNLLVFFMAVERGSKNLLLNKISGFTTLQCICFHEIPQNFVVVFFEILLSKLTCGINRRFSPYLLHWISLVFSAKWRISWLCYVRRHWREFPFTKQFICCGSEKYSRENFYWCHSLATITSQVISYNLRQAVMELNFASGLLRFVKFSCTRHDDY